jgi:hypothetical protein
MLQLKAVLITPTSTKNSFEWASSDDATSQASDRPYEGAQEGEMSLPLSELFIVRPDNS